MRIKKLKIQGFRGFTREQELDLSNNVTILYGDNSHGKSSTLNAIEWCLFGDACSGPTSTGMRERKDWKPENRLGSYECKVEMTFEYPDGEIGFKRIPSPANRGIEIRFPMGETIKGDESNKWVATNIGSFTEFMATVYQHQENIRHLAVATPGEKRETINRLLGLGEYGDLLGGIQDSHYSRTSNDVTKCLDEIDDAVSNRIRGYEDQNHTLGEEIDFDPNLLGTNDVKKQVATISGQIAQLSDSIKTDVELVGIPEDVDDIPQYVRMTKEIARGLPHQSPDERKSIELAEAITQYDSATSSVLTSKKRFVEATENVADFEKTTGSLLELQKELEELQATESTLTDQLQSMNALRAALSPLCGYLVESDLGKGKEECPACGNLAENQQTYLRTKLEELVSEPIKRAEGKLKEVMASIRANSQKIESLLSLKEVETTTREQYEISIQEAIENLELTIKPRDDIIKVLNQKKTDAIKEQEGLRASLQELSTKVSQIEAECDRLSTMAQLIRNKERINYLSQLREDPQYESLTAMVDGAEQLSQDVEAIVSAIKGVRDDESRTKVENSKQQVRQFFDEIAENPGIVDLEMALETSRGSENFKFKDGTGANVVPMMGQGDMNTLALSIFAGLGEVNLDSLPVKTIVFDDPSQSMGRHHKKRLAKVINRLAENRQVIISTMDREFKDCLQAEVTKDYVTIEFEEWDPGNGPTLV